MSIKTLHCSGCGSELMFVEDGTMEVNVESRGYIEVEGFHMPVEKCRNPFCKWSGI